MSKNLVKECYGTSNVKVVLSDPYFVQDALDAMDNGLNEDYGDEGMYYVESMDFIFSDFLRRPAEVVEETGVDVPAYYFDSYDELVEYGLEDAIIVANGKYYFNDYDDEDQPNVEAFNEDFGTHFNSFGECWNYLLDEDEMNFVVNVFKDGEVL